MKAVLRQGDSFAYRFAADCPPGQSCDPAVGALGLGAGAGKGPGYEDWMSEPAGTSGPDPYLADPGDYEKTPMPGSFGNGGGFSSGGGYGGGGSWGGGGGSDNVGDDGIMDISRPLYDALRAEFPDVTIGGYRPGGDGFDEHNNGALDIMTTDQSVFERGKELAFQHGAPWVIWQQTMHYPDGSTKPMENRGNPTQNHFDHFHTGPLRGRTSSVTQFVRRSDM